MLCRYFLEACSVPISSRWLQVLVHGVVLPIDSFAAHNMGHSDQLAFVDRCVLEVMDRQKNESLRLSCCCSYLVVAKEVSVVGLAKGRNPHHMEIWLRITRNPCHLMTTAKGGTGLDPCQPCEH